jgi:hypothetical protein
MEKKENLTIKISQYLTIRSKKEKKMLDTAEELLVDEWKIDHTINCSLFLFFTDVEEVLCCC